MADQIVNLDMFIVIEDNSFYQTELPVLFEALEANNVLLKIVTHDYDGSKHYVLTGTQAAIERVVRTTWEHDEGMLDLLDEPDVFVPV